MRRQLPCRIALAIGISLGVNFRALGGVCYDADPPQCLEPCPCAESCYQDEDCTGEQICVPDCLPSHCGCAARDGRWYPVTADCAGRCIVPPVPTGPPTYTVVELPTHSEAHANAINNFGQVVGEARFPGVHGRHACLWEGGTAIDLTPSLVNIWSTTEDINNHGQILITGSGLAFVSHNGTLSELPRLYQYGAATANAINDAGQIVGTSTLFGGAIHAVLWHDGVISDLYATLGLGSAEDINNTGHVAGGIWASEFWVPGIWRDGVLTEIPTLGGAAGLSFINDRDEVLGMSERASGDDDGFFPFLSGNDGVIDLQRETGYGSDRTKTLLNNCGDVFLSGDLPSRGTDFFLYNRERGLRPIRGVTRPATPWKELIPMGMNDRGQIVGYGIVYDGGLRAFVMSPIAGDTDTDGDIDLGDMAHVQSAFTGTRKPDIPGCERADLDGDADVDLSDFVRFKDRLGGPP